MQLGSLLNGAISEEEAAPLVTRFQGTVVKFTYNKELKTVLIGLPCGVQMRHAEFHTSEQLGRAINQRLETIQFLDDYCGFCSLDEHRIEAQIIPRQQGFVLMPWKPLFGESAGMFGFGSITKLGKPPKAIEISAGSGVTISIQLQSCRFVALKPFIIDNFIVSDEIHNFVTIMISGSIFSTGAEAASILRRVFDSLFFQVDVLTGTAYALARSEVRPMSMEELRLAIGSLPSAKSIDLREEIGFPKYQYDSDAIAYYWFARSTTIAIHLQYLSYYQVLEFYFVNYARKEARDKIKLIVKNPSFHAGREADINRILAATERRGGVAANEKNQLFLTVVGCVGRAEFKEWLMADEQRLSKLRDSKGFLDSRFSIVIPKKVDDGQWDGILDKAFESAVARVYEIRCRIVHTKSDDESALKRIGPNSSDLSQLKYDIEMVEFFAKKVLIANSEPLDLKC